MKHLLLLVGLAMAATSCTADKFEQIDANFAELELRDERLTDLINTNSDDIADLADLVQDTTEELTEYADDLAEDNQELIASLIADANNYAENLTEANTELINVNGQLITALETRQDLIETSIAGINTNLDTLNDSYAGFAQNLLELESELEDAVGDAAENLRNDITALKAEFRSDFLVLEAAVNDQLANVPGEVRGAISEAFKDIVWGEGNVVTVRAFVVGKNLDQIDNEIARLQAIFEDLNTPAVVPDAVPTPSTDGEASASLDQTTGMTGTGDGDSDGFPPVKYDIDATDSPGNASASLKIRLLGTTEFIAIPNAIVANGADKYVVIHTYEEAGTYELLIQIMNADGIVIYTLIEDDGSYPTEIVG